MFFSLFLVEAKGFGPFNLKGTDLQPVATHHRGRASIYNKYYNIINIKYF